MRHIKNPEKWIGKKASGTDYEMHWRSIDKCNDCQRLYRPDTLHSLLYPAIPADFELQKRLGIEEVDSFCPDCLAAIEVEADRVDPNWRQRHGLA